jgi:hypothetical protein
MEKSQEPTTEIVQTPDAPPPKPESAQYKTLESQATGGSVGPQYQELRKIVKKAFDLYDADCSGDLDPEE